LTAASRVRVRSQLKRKEEKRARFRFAWRLGLGLGLGQHFCFVELKREEEKKRRELGSDLRGGWAGISILRLFSEGQRIRRIRLDYGLMAASQLSNHSPLINYSFLVH
jgi:hypothetical protein